MITSNIASHLPAMAQKQPDDNAVILQSGGSYTYKQLDEVSDRYARGLQELGIVKGTRTVLMVQPGLEFFALVFALFRIGAVMVAVDPGIGIKNLGKCLTEAEPDAFIGIRKAHLARILLGWARHSIKTRVIVETSIFLGRGMFDLKQVAELGERSSKPGMNNTAADETAAVLFTSGSTGTPKGAVYTHANFNAQLEALRDTYNIMPGETDLATFPLFALYAPALGMTSIIPEMDFTRPGSVDPEKIINAIKTFKTSTMFGSPALLNRVGRWGEQHGIKLPSLKRVLSAGAPVPVRVIEKFSRLLADDVEIFTPYGATESLPVSTIGSNEVINNTAKHTDAGKGVCIGRPVRNIDVKIITITDDNIENWDEELLLGNYEYGEIAVRGPQVTRSYYNRPESTQLAKIKSGDGEIWHRMGDIAYYDDAGRLWFCGRKSERVITGVGTLFTICCEGVFNKHGKVFRSALVGINMNGEKKPVICIELEQGVKKSEHKTIKNELMEIGSEYDHTAGIKDILFHKSFPVDIRHNAKIGRPRLARWAEGKLT